ncbi:hypothetical protein K7432_003799 [Basidiobolus ranarum]|uniref:Single-stranded DNA binding protein Ssb-like OB fold domain-containing protein n=1 Tax=Basidiobolus ranarum TaxID=34480 RepID=A0ABR2WZB7_9FUNG
MTISLINTLCPGDTSISLRVKVIRIELLAETTLADETTLRVANILLADKTGSVVFSARGDQVDMFKPGTWISIQQGQIELSYGRMLLTVPGDGSIQSISPPIEESDSLNLLSNITQNQYQYAPIHQDQ